MKRICSKNGFSCGTIHTVDDRLDEDDDFAIAIELCQSPQLKRRQHFQEIIRIDSIGGTGDMANYDPSAAYRQKQAEKLRQHIEKCDSARYFADRIANGEDIRLDSKEIAKLSDAELSRIPLKTLKQWGVIS